MTPQKVYFHGAGLVTTLGGSVQQSLTALAQQMRKPTDVNFALQDRSFSIPYFMIDNPGLAYGADRLPHIIDTVIAQAINESGLLPEEIENLGLFIGSTSFDIYVAESAIKQSARTDADISRHIPPFTGPGEYIRGKFGIKGPVYTFNTACTSSANALIYAAESIRSGAIEHALVVGLEFYNETTALGFWGLELVSKKGMRPFNKKRDGLYLGEGCGAVLLSLKPAQHNFGYVAGANLGDNFSITACNPDGSTVETVINRAIAQAGIDSNQIALVKAHGTASLHNDDAEAEGLHRVFPEVPPIVVMKPYIGHTLGACGINELILFYQSILGNKLSDLSRSQSISSDFELRLAGKNDYTSPGYFLLNYFGFGGNNTALIIGNA